MRFINRIAKSAMMLCAVSAIPVLSAGTAYAEEEPVVAFPDEWMFRLGAYVVDDAKTTVSINSDLGGLGTVIDYSRDLGGEDSDTIPRIDAYYRFNPRHRIDFTSFTIDRKGERTIAIDPPLQIGDETFSGETIRSDIKYTLYRLGYQYSFYHSPKVELGVSVGLNVTSYDLKFESASGGKAENAGLTVPLPVFGLRMGYAITPKWYVRYVSEAFFIDIEDTFRGALLNYELNTEYKIFKHFAVGIGLARLGISAEVDDDDWRGKVTDSYAGYTLFGTFYF
ncbi:MAG: hypothetical protein JSW45_04640 [Thiotrichales bacterium]|nr:MAG: hypothetical protein JSW45_04640 [Thiotrichales bacterium]